MATPKVGFVVEFRIVICVADPAVARSEEETKESEVEANKLADFVKQTMPVVLRAYEMPEGYVLLERHKPD